MATLSLKVIDKFDNTICVSNGEDFVAKNAIDGVRANLSHGQWPYQSGASTVRTTRR